MKDKKMILSTLWIFITLNYFSCAFFIVIYTWRWTEPQMVNT